MTLFFSRLFSAAGRRTVANTQVADAEDDAAKANLVKLDMNEELKRDFGDVYHICREATNEVLTLLQPGGYERLGRNSPGLDDYDWSAYIDLSMLRMARVARTLMSELSAGSKVLDFGSYFGNFSLASQKLGFETSALDNYADYHPALAREREHLARSGVRILDFSHTERLLDDQNERFDAILFLGVIEHIPHTPKRLLESLYAHLNDNGLLLIDTPNLAYIYKREALMRGESVFPDLRQQYHSAVPFEGHHREYTRDEITWMLGQAGFSILRIELFNYSIYGSKQLIGEEARRYWEMDRDELKREVIFAVGRKFNVKTEGDRSD